MQSFSETAPLVLIGCGNMGQAMAAGWLRAGLAPEHFFAVDPFAEPSCLPTVPGDHFVQSAEALPNGLEARVVVLAVKPQMMDETLAQIAPLVGEGTMVMSVAAGVTLHQMQCGIGGRGTYVRVMPNTPAAIGAGISGITADAGASAADKDLARILMRAVGETVWVEEEALMDSVTAVSGSGPAYVFHMVECMAAAGVREGLPEDDAMALARQTIIGAAKLLDAQPDTPAAELRRRVTSPGGTTAAALDVLMQAGSGLGELMSRAVTAARKRGEELGS